MTCICLQDNSGLTEDERVPSGCVTNVEDNVCRTEETDWDKAW